MAQVKQRPLDEVRIPFTKMSYTPDVPSTSLGPNEYNGGYNVETDIRGIRSCSGDKEIFESLTGTPIFITGGFRYDGLFWFIVATEEGYWYANNGIGPWIDVTPGGTPITGYTQATNITESWNGNVPVFNDTINAPFFLPDVAGAIMVLYSNNTPVKDIVDITLVNATTMQIHIDPASPYATPPYTVGQEIIIANVNSYFNGSFTVTSSTTTTINYLAQPGASYPPATIGRVSAKYTWNYNPNWKKLTAGFVRMYSTPNVGNILVAGNLTATNLDDTVNTYPTTVRWSQNFGLNQMPVTWEPTVTNVANELEIPVRGPVLDAFPSNGQMFLQSYWDTTVFSPLNFTTTSVPVLGVRLYNTGRGLLTANCWGNADKTVYGIDARDIWVFDGQDFTGIGNQRVKNWFFDQLDPVYTDRVFLQINTQKNQVEIYYPTTEATWGVPNKMLAYRYDLDVWQTPRDISDATFACESPNFDFDDPDWVPNLASRTIVYARGVPDSQLVVKDEGFAFIGNTPITSLFERDNIKLLPDYSGKLLVHRILPEIVNLDMADVPINPATMPGLIGTVEVTVAGANSVGQAPVSINSITLSTDTDTPWAQINQNAFRVNSIALGNTSNSTVWLCSATTWQYTQTEDDR